MVALMMSMVVSLSASAMETPPLRVRFFLFPARRVSTLAAGVIGWSLKHR
jgi:hypothetical protein